MSTRPDDTLRQPVRATTPANGYHLHDPAARRRRHCLGWLNHPELAIASGRTVSRGALMAACLLLSGYLVPAAAESIDERIEALQRQIDELRAEQARQAEVLRTPAEDASVAYQRSAAGPQASFGGQYRINAYSADNDVTTEVDRQTASRVRIRQNIDLRFDERFDTHLQLELGHTTGNIGTSGRGTLNADNPGTGEVRVRHAVLHYVTEGGIDLHAGILPLSDRFGDSLFSGDWDYNPVAVATELPLGGGSLRLAAGSLSEGTEALNDDDVDHYQADYRVALGPASLTLGVTLLRMPDSVTSPTDTYSHANYGIALGYPISQWSVDAFILASRTDSELLGTVSDGGGLAFKFALEGPLGRGRLGLMATYAEGESDGSGFVPAMALPGTYGYWGYTGLLTVQGPTDTAIDGDAINLSNNGYGLASIQARYRLPLTTNLEGYVGAGWFGNTDAGARSDRVGTDLLLMGTYRFNRLLALDFGLASATLEDSVSGYWKGAAGGFNQATGVSRDKRAAFARLQAEF